jgi:hypothetical protein
MAGNTTSNEARKNNTRKKRGKKEEKKREKRGEKEGKKREKEHPNFFFAVVCRHPSSDVNLLVIHLVSSFIVAAKPRKIAVAENATVTFAGVQAMRLIVVATAGIALRL